MLAGGYGSRGKPFTDYSPKAMIPVDGRPTIDYIVRYLARLSVVSEIIVICEFDRLGRQMINYFEGKEGIIGKPIKFIEDKKSGTGGALLTIERHVHKDECFLVWFADNLCALKISDMLIEYQRLSSSPNGDSITGLVGTRRRRFEETGRVVLDYSGENNGPSSATARVRQFIEKGEIVLEYPEAVGIYLLTAGIFRFLHIIANKMHGSINLSHDLLMHIRDFGGNLYSFDIGDQTMWIDLESPSYADRNQNSITKVLSQMNKFVENS